MAHCDVITARAYCRDDYDAVVALWREGGQNPFLPEAAERVIAAGGNVLVAESADAGPVGVIVWTHNGRQGFVWRLAVAASHRRRGIGSHLLQLAEQEMREAGFPSAGMLVYRENETAKRMYEQQGWEPNERLETWWKKL